MKPVRNDIGGSCDNQLLATRSVNHRRRHCHPARSSLPDCFATRNYLQVWFSNAANIGLTLNPRRTSIWAPLAVTFTKMQDRTRALEAMWLAYQFSADKQKTLDFLNTR